ncbi:MAG: PHP domain-containing protein [Firmicutes bacterium]|nr:PHP domain-containing protein [Bacillota bacterium]
MLDKDTGSRSKDLEFTIIKDDVLMTYKYELHAHTAEVSKCSRISGVDLVRFYKNKGYSGLCITDHFFNGNTSVPRNLPWKERVNLLCIGYENAFKEGQKLGIDVFFGWEWSLNGTDILTFGLTKEWLLDHPDILSLSLNDYCDLAHESGAFLAHAHPFREASYIDMIRLFPRKVDAVEVLNAERTDFENERAEEYANNYALLKIACSDNHVGKQKRYCGIKTSKRLGSLREITDVIRKREIQLFTEYEKR